MRYLLLILALFLFSCEDVVMLDSPSSPAYFVVESTLTNLPGPQSIKLSKSQPYFDNSNAPAVSAAQVRVSDDAGNTYVFTESATPGTYTWTPKDPSEVFGKVGRTYSLAVNWSGSSFAAKAKMNRVPPIDSILYEAKTANARQAGDGKPKEGFEAQFYGKDLIGAGDCYRIKYYKNDKLFNATSNLLIVFDSALQRVAGTDGLMFNLPVRTAISPELYEAKDKIKVEIYSITNDQFSFYSQARLELNNAGLFAIPAANIPTNIQQTAGSMQAAGWFGVSAVSSLETVVDPTKARKNLR
jgi:hypothetical protein